MYIKKIFFERCLSMLNGFLGEFIGTIILIVFGTGLLAAMNLKKTLNSVGTWVIITFGWGFAVMLGVYAAYAIGAPGHLNPAVSVAFACFGMISWTECGVYIAAQMTGAFIGAALTIIHYWDHFKATPKEIDTGGIFFTAPAIKNVTRNLLSEIFATFFFLFCFLLIAKDYDFSEVAAAETHSLLPISAGFLVAAIGMSFGATTGYAINPCRDLATRIAYAVLPVPNKSPIDWSYAWIPVIGPIIGAILATLVYTLVM